MKVQNKVIVITGAGSGMGRELSLLLLSKGARVAGIDIAASSLEETGRLAARYKDQFAGFVANIADKLGVEALPEQVTARFGAVDGIINNAGIIQPFRKLNDLDYATIERVLNVNLLGTVFCTKTFLPRLLERPAAHIVNISRMGGFVPVPGQTIYGATKAAVKLLSEGLASELIGTNVRVTAVFPGAVATNILENSGVNGPKTDRDTAVSKLLPANTAVQIIVRAMERDAERVFVGRDAALMDKLYRLSPAYAARAVASKMRALIPG